MLETATGVFLYTFSQRCSRYMSIQSILNIFGTIWAVILNIVSFVTTWSDAWEIPSLIEDDSISIAIAEAFECLSASEIWLIPDTTCGGFSTHLAKQFESNLCRNSELLTIGCEGQFVNKNVKDDSLEVVFQWTSVPESFESNSLPHIIYEQSLASTENFESNPSLDYACNEATMASSRDSHLDLSVNSEDQHSQSECSTVYTTPERSSPPNSALKDVEDQYLQSRLSINTQDQDLQSGLGINGEDEGSDSELIIIEEQSSIASSISEENDCIMVNSTPEFKSLIDTSLDESTMILYQHSAFELGMNGEDRHAQPELDMDAEQLSITLPKEETYKCPSVFDSNPSLDTTCINATMPLDQHAEPELSIDEDQLQIPSSKPITNKFLNVDENNSPFNAQCIKPTIPSDQHLELELNIHEEPLQFASSKAVVPETPHPSEPEYDKNEGSSPYESVPKTPEKKEELKTISNSDDSVMSPPARVSPSAYLFARCFQTPEARHSISLMPLAYHSEYKRLAESCKPSESTCSPPLNSLQFQSESSKEAETTLFTITFNQNFTCFACGTDQGIKVYKCDPFEEIFNGYFGDGGISIVEMYYSTKILVFVGSEDNFQCPPDKVIIWDYEFHKCVHELTADSKVKAVKISRDHMVVVLEQETCVYSCLEIEAKLLYTIKTLPNTRGLCALSDMPSNPVLVCPGLLKGQVCIEHFLPRKTRFVSAHDSHIACIALSKYGAILATASKKGTLLRIFNTSDGTCLQEVRRGSKRAEIYSIGISEIAQLLALCSDKGTVHIVCLNEKVGKHERLAKRESNNLTENSWRQWNASSGETGRVLQRAHSSSFSFSFMKGVVPKYFNSDKSFAQFRFSPKVRCLVGFGKDNTIIIICYDGSFYKCTFDPVRGGEMVQKLYERFFKPDEALIEV